MKSYGLTIQMKPLYYYFHMILFFFVCSSNFCQKLMEYCGVIISNETSSPMLSHRTIFFKKQNPVM